LSTEKLKEVVVIGYGTTRKKDLTGSITQVTSDEFQSGQITSPEQLIAGKVPGVSVISNGGAPGAGSTIRIRGGASLNASNDPLIVLDGVPLSNDGISGVYSPLSMINQDDIETFTILKDASATAIYGSRASNGVIIITTKKGRLGKKPTVNFNTSFSVSEAGRKANVLSPTNFRRRVIETGNQKYINLLGDANTNWQEEIYQTALATDNNISISGGFKKMPYRVSLGYLDQEGVLKTGKLERFSGGINVSPQFFEDHLKIDINLKGSVTNTRFANQGAIGAAVYFDPTKPVMSGNNRYNGYWQWLDPSSTTGLRGLAPRNPVGLLMDEHNLGEAQRSIGNALIDYKFHFLPDLHAFVNVGYDISKGTGTLFINDSAAQTYKRSPDGKVGGVNTQFKQEKTDKLLEAYLNYTKSFGRNRLEVIGGYAYQDFLTTNYSFADFSANKIQIGANPNYEFDKPQYTLISYYGRANLSISNRYILTGTIRTDGSSKFSIDNRWGVFPSGAFAWNIKNEKFLDNSIAVTDLKLRLGYGITGQQSGIGYYDFNSFYNLSGPKSQYQFGNEFYNMYAPTGYNPNLTWEETETYNAGLDYGFANNRITGAIDVYYKKTSKLLNSIVQPAGSNFSNEIVANVGDMENKGIEVTLNLQPIKKSNFVWDLNLNATYNENKITNLTALKTPDFKGNRFYGISGGTGNTILINSVGYPRGSFYTYKQAYSENGLPIDGLFEDLNRDGIINEDDFYRYKSTDPNCLIGASSNFNINNKFNAGFVLRGSIGNYMYNNVFSATSTMRNILNPLNYLNNAAAGYLMSGVGDKYFLSDYYVQNASFLRMDNIYLSYRVGKVLKEKADLTVNANFQNVFIITNYVGLDPENSSGVDNNVYPRPRVLSLGLNLNF
ncbi:MAG: SusC/RagA family TonB-linked outer membrane protein, partial [Ginsengibacter sp.]